MIKKYNDLFSEDFSIFRLTENFFNNHYRFLNSNFKDHPKFSVVKKDNEFIIKAELPGYEEKDVKINIDNNILTISGKHESSNDNDEFSSNITSFEQSYTLDRNLDLDQISAVMKSGMLVIKIPQIKEKSESRTIPINKS